MSSMRMCMSSRSCRFAAWKFAYKQQGSKMYLFSSLPLGKLSQPLLASPNTGVNDLEEQLTRPGIEDEDGAIDRLGGQVTLKGFVDGHTVHVGVIHKPDDLVTEQLSIVLHRRHTCERQIVT